MKRLFLIILTIVSGCVCNAKEGNFSFKSLTTDMGLSHGDIFCFLQDYEGYLWIGTSDGLNKFDGISFTVSKHNKNDLNSLSSSYISCLYEDKDHNLWIGVLDGLCRYNREKNSYERYNYPDNHGHLFSHHVYSILEDENNKLWLGTQDGIFVFNKKDKTFTAFFDRNQGKEILTYCSDIKKDTKGNLLFVLKNNVDGGLLKYNQTNGSTQKFCSQYGSIRLKENLINCILVDNSNNVWIGYNSNGIEVINFENNKRKSYTYKQADPGSLSNNSIFSLTKDSKGCIYIGTGQGGLNVFDPVDEKFSHYVSSESDNSLLSNIIQSIYIDHNGTLWVGCWGGGINYFDRRFDRFTLYKNGKYDPYSLSGSSVTCFSQDKNKNIWVSSDGGGINLFNSEQGNFKRFNNIGLSSNKVLALAVDKKNCLWAGMWPGGLSYFQIEGKNLVLIKNFTQLTKDEPNSSYIFRILTDNEGELWVGTYATGAYKFNWITSNFEPVKLSGNSNEYTIRDIFADSSGNIWFATEYFGLYKLNKKTGVVYKYVNNKDDSTSISGNSVNCIFEDSRKRIWVGVDEGGLNLFDPHSSSFKHFNTDNGLPDNTVVGILEDNKRNLWLSTHMGISKAKIDTVDSKLRLTFKNYSASDGLQGNVFNRWAYFKSKNGELYFGGLNGFNVFHPDSIHENHFQPPVLFTDFLLFNKPVPIGVNNSPLKNHISQTRKLVLKHNQSFFTFRFVALNYIFSEKNEYAYFLEGFDKDWNYIGNKREATYTNLPPGNYIFKVIASNNDGTWNRQGASIDIEILPPWWGTLWFKAGFILALMFSLFGIYINKVNSFRRRQIVLEKMVEERTSELKEINVSLEEKQEEINMQKEELEEQKNYLLETNNKLKEQQNFITTQNLELDKHRYELESLISERTKELETAKSKAEESDKLKSSFLANMSHEIRTPMNAIMGFSNLLCDENLSAEEKKNFVDIIIRSGESLLVLIDDILDLSKIQAGQLTLTPKPLNIDEFFQELQNTFSIEASRYKLELLLNKNNLSSHYLILVDSVRLKQIFSNLISNAIKFTSEGNIEFGIAGIKDNKIVFFVKDTGIGIHENIGDSIFETFLKIETDSTKLFGGVGLGLAICKSLVNLMGGEIWYNSVVNLGTTFFFSIPLVKITDDHEIKHSKAKTKLKVVDLTNKVILVAEDEVNNFKLISAILKKTNAKILWAKDGIEAVEISEKEPKIDLIIMDIKMPLMNGIEANKIIKSKRNDVIVIAHSAFVYEEDIKRFLAAGFDYYLPKPLNVSDIMDVLEKFLL